MVQQYFISDCGYEGHISILCSWSLISHVPITQLALVSWIMEAVHLQDWNILWTIPVSGLDFFRFSNQWFISHSPKRVTWIWISRCCTRIESLFVFNKYNTLNVFKLGKFQVWLSWRRVYLKGSEIVIWFWSGHCVKFLFYPLMLEYNFLDVSLEIRKENNPNILIMESEMFHVNLLSPIWVVTHGFIIYIHRLYVPFTHSELGMGFL